MRKFLKSTMVAAAAVIGAVGLSACSDEKKESGAVFTPQQMADALNVVMRADRTIYAQKVINRLVRKEKVIKASEHFEDDKALPLPAQMFRMGAEVASDKTKLFSYQLLSNWPINKQNKPASEIEKAGLDYVYKNPDKAYYGEQMLGGKKYFTAIYPDSAVAQACVSCHNEHKDSPRTDFKMGEVMGGIVVRIPLAM
jgi:hypothetical protein